MEGTGVAKAQVVGGGSLFTTGLVMFVSGIVVLAADCSTVNKPWVLLVYGLVTMLTWVWPLWAGIDRWRFSTPAQLEIEHNEYVFVP